MRRRHNLLPQELDALTTEVFAPLPRPCAYWWVNQGSTYKEAKEQGCIWAPKESKAGTRLFHWDNVSTVKEGDLVFHYADGSLRALSRAKGAGYESEKTLGSDEWSSHGWRVDMAYVELARAVPIGELGPRVAELNLAKGPINRAGGVNQGYLFGLSEQAVDRILGVLGADPALVAVGLPVRGWISLRTARGAFWEEIRHNHRPRRRPRPRDRKPLGTRFLRSESRTRTRDEDEDERDCRANPAESGVFQRNQPSTPDPHSLKLSDRLPGSPYPP